MGRLDEATKRLQGALDRLEQVVEAQAGNLRAPEANAAKLRRALQTARQENASLQSVAGTVTKRLDKTIAQLKTALEA